MCLYTSSSPRRHSHARNSQQLVDKCASLLLLQSFVLAVGTPAEIIEVGSGIRSSRIIIRAPTSVTHISQQVSPVWKWFFFAFFAKGISRRVEYSSKKTNPLLSHIFHTFENFYILKRNLRHRCLEHLDLAPVRWSMRIDLWRMTLTDFALIEPLPARGESAM